MFLIAFLAVIYSANMAFFFRHGLFIFIPTLLIEQRHDTNIKCLATAKVGHLQKFSHGIFLLFYSFSFIFLTPASFIPAYDYLNIKLHLNFSFLINLKG